MEEKNKVDVGILLKHMEQGHIVAFKAMCFDAIKFDAVTELVSFDEKEIDSCVEHLIRSRKLVAKKVPFIIKFNGSWTKKEGFDQDHFERWHHFGAFRIFGIIRFDTETFKPVDPTEWSFDEEYVKSEVQKLIKKGVKADAVRTYVKFHKAFCIKEEQGAPA